MGGWGLCISRANCPRLEDKICGQHKVGKEVLVFCNGFSYIQRKEGTG